MSTLYTSIGGKKPVKAKVPKAKVPKATGGYNLAPLVSALLLAGIKLALAQNNKLADKLADKLTDKRKGSTPKRKTKSMPRPNTV